MEQHIQNSRFLVLTGHLNDYPLSDLVGILRHQHKTGRLLIEYPNGPASFYFNDGELVDAQFHKLNGLQALCVAQAQPPSSFNFNPLVRPSRRSIENSLQKAVSELLGCWSENDCEIEQLPSVKATPMSLPAAEPSMMEIQATKPEALTRGPLALPPAARPFSNSILAMSAAGLLLLGLSTLITVTGGFGKDLSPATVSNSLAPGDKASIPNENGGPATNPADTETRNDLRVSRSGKGREVVRATQHSVRQEDRSASTDNNEAASANSTPAPVPTKPDQNHEKSEIVSDTQSVKVLLQIEGGRVAKASIANPRSGMEAYEAMALRIARQRRFPSNNASQETVTIKVNQPK
jgi:uncharacterized protein DUF4388